MLSSWYAKSSAQMVEILDSGTGHIPDRTPLHAVASGYTPIESLQTQTGRSVWHWYDLFRFCTPPSVLDSPHQNQTVHDIAPDGFRRHFVGASPPLHPSSPHPKRVLSDPPRSAENGGLTLLLLTPQLEMVRARHLAWNRVPGSRSQSLGSKAVVEELFGVWCKARRVLFFWGCERLKRRRFASFLSFKGKPGRMPRRLGSVLSKKHGSERPQEDVAAFLERSSCGSGWT